MNRDEFMKRVEYLISDLPEEETRDALDYYRDYLEEAGDAAEEAMREFGSPERIASIIRTAGNLRIPDIRMSGSVSRTASWREGSRLPVRTTRGSRIPGGARMRAAQGRRPMERRAHTGRLSVRTAMADMLTAPAAERPAARVVQGGADPDRRRRCSGSFWR